MEKILLAIDATSVNMASVEFAGYIARLTKSKLTGVFLENFVADEKPVLRSSAEGGIEYLDWGVDANSPEHIDKIKTIEKNISLFKDACTRREVSCSVHCDEDVPLKELIQESRFADLIIIDPFISFSEKPGAIPNSFLKKVLKQSECPVIIAPESFTQVDEIIFAYDGSESSVFAIKQFIYLFPELKQKKAVILEIKKDNEDRIDGKEKLKELLDAHFTDVDFSLLHGYPGQELFLHLLKKKNAFLVTGAYGRTTIANMFRKSRAEMLLKAVNVPIFITHH